MLTERVQDAAGLICAFGGGSDAPELLTLHGATVIVRERARPVWLHFNVIDTRARDWIAACEWLPATAREFLLGSDHYVHFERAGDGLTAVVLRARDLF